ncbi:MAG TPA: hypothetical protein VJQ25_07370, partial [Nitrospira sp.]|nr:hypothetical protein [Nitrospira sp.]
MNRKRASGSADLPDYPTVFVPEFSKTTDSIILSGFHETQDANQLNKVWRDFPDALTNAPIGTLTNFNFYGQHFVIGTKKGHPNFNELALQANVEVSRKLAARKASLGSTNIVSTNQMFVVSMNNRWGMETWNSYRTNYRDLRTISGEVISHVVMRDGTNIFNNPPIYDGFVTNLIVLNNTIPQVADWIGATQLVTTNFIVLFDNFTRLLDERSYSTNRGFGTNRFGLPGTPAEFGPLERTPEFVLYTTNKVRFWMINKDNRIVDFVSFDNLSTIMDLRKHLFPPPNSQSGSSLVTGTAQLTENMFWDPTPIGGPGSVLTVGHSNQLAMSSGDFEGPASDALWRSYRYNSPDKRGAISVWRYFLYGPRGIRAQDEMPRNPPAVLTHQAPFTPTKSISWSMSWQV